MNDTTNNQSKKIITYDDEFDSIKDYLDNIYNIDNINVDEVFGPNDKRENWFKFLNICKDKYLLTPKEDFSGIKINPKAFRIFQSHLKKIKFKNPSRITETAGTEYGFICLYRNVIKPLQIQHSLSIQTKILELSEKDQKILSIPIPRINVPIRSKNNTNRRITIHTSDQINATISDTADLFLIPAYQLTQICWIFTFNSFFQGKHMADDYALYYSDNGYIKHIIQSFEQYSVDLIRYIYHVKPILQEHIKINEFRISNHLSNINDDLPAVLKRQKNLIIKIEKYLTNPEISTLIDQHKSKILQDLSDIHLDNTTQTTLKFNKLS